jgi:NAD(P)-dependent dehydrogenase (short-subunit alcohol dehydrogenase family)
MTSHGTHGGEMPAAPATVLVTGAGRGLGLALARCFADVGLHVIAACRDAQGAARLLPDGVEVRALDLGDPPSIMRLASEMQGRAIDYLVNNAAIRGSTDGLPGVTAPDFLEVMAVNTLAPLLMVREFLPHLRRGARRVVANISSRAGSMAEGYDGDGDYAYRCSKAALNMATVKLAGDFAAEGITILALHPGWVKTDMGGPEAEIPVEDSAAAVAKLILAADPSCSGGFRNFDGTAISW